MSCFSDTEAPTRWEKLTCCTPTVSRPRTAGTWKLMMVTPNDLTTSQSVAGLWAGHTPRGPLPHSLLTSGSPEAFRGFRSSEHELPGLLAWGLPWLCTSFTTTLGRGLALLWVGEQTQLQLSNSDSPHTVRTSFPLKQENKAITTAKPQQLAI